jgi:hypothetical protein
MKLVSDQSVNFSFELIDQEEEDKKAKENIKKVGIGVNRLPDKTVANFFAKTMVGKTHCRTIVIPVNVKKAKENF